MPQINPTGFAAVIHSMTLLGDPEPMAITYGVGFDGPLPVAQAQNACNALRSAFTDNMSNIIATGYAHKQTEMIVGGFTPPLVYLDPTPVVFTGTINPLPQNSALLVQKRSALIGRRHRGRLYIPGVNEVEVAPNGVVSPALLAAYNSALQSWLTAIRNITEVLDMFILHTQAPLAPAPPEPTRVSTLVADDVIATQRRRLR
jgi:hypothetical protein